MFRRSSLFGLPLAAAVLTISLAQQKPEFKPAPEVPAMPKALMKLPRTNITRAKFPAVDIHFHGRSLRTSQDYEKMIRLMDQTGLAVITNLDGGFGQSFDQVMKLDEPYKDRILPFARLNYEGLNEKGWSAKAAAELERCFKAGANGLKIWASIPFGRCARGTTNRC
jgi:hypothetical protein